MRLLTIVCIASIVKQTIDIKVEDFGGDLEVYITELKASIENINKAIATINGSISGIEKNVDGVSSRLEALSTQVSKIKKKQIIFIKRITIKCLASLIKPWIFFRLFNS